MNCTSFSFSRIVFFRKECDLSHLHVAFSFISEASEAWMDSDRDYSYDELLQRVFGIMRDRNPDMVAGEKKKFVMRPPQVVKVGTKKTAFVNFTEIAKM